MDEVSKKEQDAEKSEESATGKVLPLRLNDISNK